MLCDKLVDKALLFYFCSCAIIICTFYSRQMAILLCNFTLIIAECLSGLRKDNQPNCSCVAAAQSD